MQLTRENFLNYYHNLCLNNEDEVWNHLKRLKFSYFDLSEEPLYNIDFEKLPRSLISNSNADFNILFSLLG